LIFLLSDLWCAYKELHLLLLSPLITRCLAAAPILLKHLKLSHLIWSDSPIFVDQMSKMAKTNAAATLSPTSRPTMTVGERFGVLRLPPRWSKWLPRWCLLSEQVFEGAEDAKFSENFRCPQPKHDLDLLNWSGIIGWRFLLLLLGFNFSNCFHIKMSKNKLKDHIFK
jgi:hypothetical protein